MNTTNFYKISERKCTQLEKLLPKEAKPYLEPIDCATIDEGWKLADTIAKSISYWAHRKHDMHLFANSLDEEVEQSNRTAIRLFSLFSLPVDLSHFLAYFLLLVGRKEVWHLSRIQQVIDIFKECFLFDLWNAINEQTHCLKEG